MTARAKLLAKGRKQGPCGMCGATYAPHRIWDAIDCALRYENEKAVAREYGVTVAEVRLVRDAYADARRRHAALPGRGDV
jgi:hypothetical protein